MAAAHAAGFFPTDVQLKAWRREGLIPRPLAQHGRGKARGSITVYPAGTTEQLIALGELRKREHQLGSLAFLLWWQGFPIPSTSVREALAQVIDKAETVLSELVTDDDLTEPGWDGLERLEQDPRVPPSLKRARKRAGKFSMSTVGRLLVLSAAGAFPGWGAAPEGETSDRDLVGTAIGIGVLNGVLSAFGAKVRIPEDAETALGVLSDHVSPETLSQVLVESTDQDLETARAELCEFAALIADVLYLSEKTPDLLASLQERDLSHAINPVSLLGLQAFGMIVQQLAPDWKRLRTTDIMLLFLAGLSLCRNPAFRRGLRSVTTSHDHFHSVRIEAEKFFLGHNDADSK